MINIIFKLKNKVLSANAYADMDFAEKKMLELVNRYRSIIDNQQDLICRFSPNGTITFVNQAFGEFFNKAQEEVIGLNMVSFFHGDQNELDKTLEKLAEGGAITELRCQPGPDGAIRWLQCVCTRVFDSNLEEIQFVGHQVSQETIASVWQQFESGTGNKCDVAGLPVVILQPDLTIDACNPMFESFSGYSSDEILGPELFSVLVLPDLLEIILAYKILPRTPKDFELQCIDRFGNIRDVVISTSCLKRDGRLVLTFVDVTKKYINNDLVQTLRDDSIIVVCNTNGVILAINRLCEDVVGLYNEQIKGMKYWEAFCPDKEKSMAKRLFKSVVNGKDSVEIKQNWLAANGKVKTMLLKNFPLLNVKGNIEYIIMSGEVVK